VNWVNTPSSSVREREKEREREKKAGRLRESEKEGGRGGGERSIICISIVQNCYFYFLKE
jgi:hypothetical protein